MNEKRINILNKIKNKPIIIERIFSYTLNRPYILYHLISNDNHLKDKLNNTFTDVNKTKNNLGEEFCQNLTIYSNIKHIINKIEELLKEKENKPFTYTYIKNNLEYSYINFLYTSLMKSKKMKKIKKLVNEEMIKKIFIEIYSVLKDVDLIYLPYPYMENEYIKLIEDMNKFSKEQNKKKQKIKLLLIFDENCFYNSEKFNLLNNSNIYEIEIIFGNKFIHCDNLLEKINLFLSKIKNLEKIQKLTFHNLNYDNYLNISDSNKDINDEIYQSILGFLADEYYSKNIENYANFNIIRKSIKEFGLKDIDFLYIFEKFKLFYSMIDIFKCFNENKTDSGLSINIPFYINDKMLLIINKEKTKVSDMLTFIEHIMKAHPNILYLFLVNHSELINDQVENKIEINLQNIKEFEFITNESMNSLALINNIILSENEKEKDFNIYKGYDNNGNLIMYRQGITNIQSFDLIDLFKYNKILTKIKMIKENIEINYNEERTKLEILNISPNKTELDDIINDKIKIRHFEQFIYNQNSLKEMTIKYFDYQLKNLENKNINVLTINYDKDLCVLKYKKIKDDKIEPQKELIKLFPSLTTLNIGGNCQWFLDMTLNDIPSNLKTINIITDKQNKKLSKLMQKLNKKGKKIFIEYINNNDERNNEEEEEEEAEYDEHDYPVTGIKGSAFYGVTMHGLKYRKKEDIFIYDSPNPKDMKFIKDFNKEHYKNLNLDNFSKILQNFKKNAKMDNFLDKLSFNYESTIKLVYRASEDKEQSFEKLINSYLNSSNSILLIKTSLDLYFIKLYHHKIVLFDFGYKDIYDNYYIFDNEDYLKIDENEQKLNIQIGNQNGKAQIELTNTFTIFNSFNSGKIINDIKFKHKKFEKGTTFSIIDAEVFSLIEKRKE